MTVVNLYKLTAYESWFDRVSFDDLPRSVTAEQTALIRNEPIHLFDCSDTDKVYLVANSVVIQARHTLDTVIDLLRTYYPSTMIVS